MPAHIGGEANDADGTEGTESTGGAEGAEGTVALQVRVRAEHLALLKGFAEREGATVEALASLWIEEKLGEAIHSSHSSQSSP